MSELLPSLGPRFPNPTDRTGLRSCHPGGNRRSDLSHPGFDSSVPEGPASLARNRPPGNGIVSNGQRAEAWIGTSGYTYRHWRKGVFYPAGLPAREELAYFASRFRTVELNNPFYRLPTAEMFERWRDTAPPDF